MSEPPQPQPQPQPRVLVVFAASAAAGIKSLDQPQDIAALTAARDRLATTPYAGTPQPDGLFRLYRSGRRPAAD